jgi:tRNA(fMet)-specific endonuclease VapC
MAIILLDTTVASFLSPFKEITPERQYYRGHITGNTLALSFQSVAELWKWAEKNSWGQAKRNQLEQFIKRFVIIPYDNRLAQMWAHLSVQCEKQGKSLGSGDCWIAATAVAHGISLLAHDRHFVEIKISGLTVISYYNQTISTS